MEFGQEEQKDHCSDDKEEDQDQEEEEEDYHNNQVRTTINTNTTNRQPLSFCAPSSSSSQKWPRFTGGDKLLLLSDNNNSTSHNHLQLMDYLSLKTSHHDGVQAAETRNTDSGSGRCENRGVLLCPAGEREHMFDKVVTPSDVGKLNRLVIPKQHAEKYFPLDSSSNEKGLLLNFEDRSGKSWRFRYSYWNSSQSYVMTKGWSRFVKEKKLDAGDIVSFERGVGESARGRLFIDWRRRPHHHHFQYHHHLLSSNPASLLPIEHHRQFHPYHHQQQRWGGGGGSDGGGMLYSLPSSMSVLMPPLHLPPPRSHESLDYNYNNSIVQYPNHHHQQQHQYQYHHHNLLSDHHNHHHHDLPVLINSMPAAAAPPKRLRLFGVNMEYCPNQEDQASSDHHGVTVESAHHDHDHHHLIPSSSVQYPLQVRIPNNPSPIFPRPTNFPAEFSHKGKSANSLSFDLDP